MSRVYLVTFWDTWDTRYDVWDTWDTRMGHLGHSKLRMGHLGHSRGTLGTLAWDTWDTPNYVWDTHVGHYLNKYMTLCGMFTCHRESSKCPVSHYCSVVT